MKQPELEDQPFLECGIKLLSVIPRRTGQYGKHITAFPSKKNLATRMCDTLLEANFCILLERWKPVKSYETQSLTYNFSNINRRYTPDFLVHFIDGSTSAYELKNEIALEDKHLAQQLTELKIYFNKIGICYEWLGRSRLPKPALMNNLRYLYFHSYGANPQGYNRLKSYLSTSSTECSTIKSILNAGFRSEDIAYSLFHGDINCNLETPIDCNSYIWVSRHG